MCIKMYIYACVFIHHGGSRTLTASPIAFDLPGLKNLTASISIYRVIYPYVYIKCTESIQRVLRRPYRSYRETRQWESREHGPRDLATQSRYYGSSHKSAYTYVIRRSPNSITPHLFYIHIEKYMQMCILCAEESGGTSSMTFRSVSFLFSDNRCKTISRSAYRVKSWNPRLSNYPKRVPAVSHWT